MHHYACDSVAVVKAHTVAMNFIAVAFFAHQQHSTICGRFDRISLPGAVVHTPVVVAAQPNTTH